MSAEEICREYRTAKDQKAQIGILADLNACSPAQIKKILQENGEAVELRGRPSRPPQERAVDAPPKAPKRPKAPASAARAYIEDLLARRKAAEEQIREIDRELYALVNMIADGSEKKPGRAET